MVCGSVVNHVVGRGLSSPRRYSLNLHLLYEAVDILPVMSVLPLSQVYGDRYDAVHVGNVSVLAKTWQSGGIEGCGAIAQEATERCGQVTPPVATFVLSVHCLEEGGVHFAAAVMWCPSVATAIKESPATDVRAF